MPDRETLREALRNAESASAEHIAGTDWRAPLRAMLDEAGRLVSSDRSSAYGRPLDNHERIAALWRVWLGDDHIHDEEYESVPVTASDAAMMMLLVKVARLMETPDHHDSIADLIGYALVYADCVAGGRCKVSRGSECPTCGAPDGVDGFVTEERPYGDGVAYESMPCDDEYHRKPITDTKAGDDD